jgi:hypothetical protein
MKEVNNLGQRFIRRKEEVRATFRVGGVIREDLDPDSPRHTISEISYCINPNGTGDITMYFSDGGAQITPFIIDYDKIKEREKQYRKYKEEL